ncbi:MAG: gamma-glutamylcyclotransferase [Pseudomonadales bacterium]
MNVWLFGYGSLIWRPDIDYIERSVARVHGWARRFWQGSHDHRGLPDKPGRVVTLVAQPGAVCDGMAYLVSQRTAARTFEALDHREKNGYQRHEVRLELPAQRHEPGIVYIAPVDNFAYLGPAPLEDMARQIHESAGPSGSNRDYLLELAAVLRDMDAEDEHVYELEAAVRRLS